MRISDWSSDVCSSDLGAVRHGVVERSDRRGKGIDHLVLGAARMIAREDRLHEGVVDRPPLRGREFRQLLAALLQRRAALAGPHEGVERQALHPLRMALGAERGAQRAGGDAVRSEEHTSELKSLMRISYADFCLKTTS